MRDLNLEFLQSVLERKLKHYEVRGQNTLSLKRLLIQGEAVVNMHRIRMLICSLINRGRDMFPYTDEYIHGIVSTRKQRENISILEY